MNRKYYKKSLKFKVLERIQRLRGNIVQRKDIQEMAGPRQLSRCFRDLVLMGKLIKIGYGIYAKAYTSQYTSKPIIQGGFSSICKEALTKLGIQWEPGTAEKEYNAGLSTQVPVRTIVQLKSRYRGRLSYGNRTLVVENGVNAR